MLNIKALSQRDPKWASELLGFNANTYTIGGYGCLITSLVVMANYYGKTETPSTLNKKLKDAKGFSDGNGYYVWGAISKVFPEIKEEWLGRFPDPLTNDQMDAIKNAIKTGYPVMVEIDFKPETAQPDMHFVLLVGYDANDEDNFTMMDPWTGSIGSLKMYLKASKPTARRSIEQIAMYKAQIPQTPTENLEDTINKLQDQVIEIRASRDKWKKKYEDYLEEHASDVSKKDKQIEQMQETLTNTSASLLAATGQVTTLSGEKDDWLKKEKEVWEPMKTSFEQTKELLKTKTSDYNILESKYLADLNKKPIRDLIRAILVRG